MKRPLALITTGLTLSSCACKDGSCPFGFKKKPDACCTTPAAACCAPTTAKKTVKH